MLAFFFILFLMFSILSWYIIQFPDGSLDQNILLEFQKLHTDFLTQVAKTLALLGGLPSMLIFSSCIIGYAYLKKDYLMVYLVSIGVSLTAMTSWLLKWSFSRSRPFLETQLVETYGSAYPSGHSAYAMMLACILFYISHGHRYQYLVMFVAVVWVIIMGCSRIYLGVHYLTDVLAGWLLAAMVMLLIKLNLDRFSISKQQMQRL